MPRLTDRDNQTFATALRALQAWAEGEPPQDIAARPALIRYIHDAVNPALCAAACSAAHSFHAAPPKKHSFSAAVVGKFVGRQVIGSE